MPAITVRTLPQGDAWLRNLRDSKTKARLPARPRKVQRGNMGEVATVGDDLCEMREHFGSGWRLYYVRRDVTAIVLLAGGSKKLHAPDIAAAKRLAAQLKDEDESKRQNQGKRSP